MTMIVGILLVLVIKIMFFHKSVYYPSLAIPSLLALSSIPLVSTIVLLSFLFSQIDMTIRTNYFELIVVFGILFMNIGIIYLYNSLSEHLREINQVILQNRALEAEMKYISEIKRSQKVIRSMRHDLKNHFLVLLSLIDQGNTKDAEAYLHHELNTVTSDQHFYTHDLVLNYLLNEKIAVARKTHTAFDVKVLLSAKINIDHDILSVLIGNLIDNALEATSRLPHDLDGRFISLTIKQFKNNLLIDISNSYDSNEALTRHDRKLVGLGTANIKHIVNTYNGLYHQWTENSTYFVSIMLLNVV